MEISNNDDRQGWQTSLRRMPQEDLPVGTELAKEQDLSMLVVPRSQDLSVASNDIINSQIERQSENSKIRKLLALTMFGGFGAIPAGLVHKITRDIAISSEGFMAAVLYSLPTIAGCAAVHFLCDAMINSIYSSLQCTKEAPGQDKLDPEYRETLRSMETHMSELQNVKLIAKAIGWTALVWNAKGILFSIS